MEIQRRTVLVALGIAVVAAAALAAVLVLVSRGGAERASTTSTVAAARPVLFRGLPQTGMTLGDPSAPALYEYADLQCPYCALLSRELLPVIVRDYVRTGRVRLVFNGLAFLGPDSVTALQAVYSAGLQDRGWDVLEALFRRQGTENTGWVTAELLQEVGAGVGGLDVAKWGRQMGSPEVQRGIADSATAATNLGIHGTPTLVFGGRMVPLAAIDPDALHQALDPMLAE